MSLGGQIKTYLTLLSLKVHVFLTPFKKYSMNKLQKKSSVWEKVKKELRVMFQRIGFKIWQLRMRTLVQSTLGRGLLTTVFWLETLSSASLASRGLLASPIFSIVCPRRCSYYSFCEVCQTVFPDFLFSLLLAGFFVPFFRFYIHMYIRAYSDSF